MNSVRVATASVVVGLALGIGSTVAQLGLARGEPNLAEQLRAPGRTRPDPVPANGPQPKVHVDQILHDFGAMQRGAKGTHRFVFTNEGDYPLELQKGSTSCKCTFSRVAEGKLAPGESAEVVLEWNVKGVGDHFREIATILTNDPKRRRVDLSVTGRIVQALVVTPSQLTFSRLPVDQSQIVEVRLVAFEQYDLQVLETELVDDDTREFFDVQVHPIRKDDLGDPDAKSGVLLIVVLSPGLPVGRFQQELVVTLNGEEPQAITIPISGRVVGDMSIIGPGWSSDLGRLDLGTVKKSQGAERRLTILVRGEDPGAVTIEPLKVDPDFIRVRLGERTELKGGQVVSVPLFVEVPAGSRPVNRLGTQQGAEGEIVLQTSHPRTKQLRLKLRFAVEE